MLSEWCCRTPRLIAKTFLSVFVANGFVQTTIGQDDEPKKPTYPVEQLSSVALFPWLCFALTARSDVRLCLASLREGSDSPHLHLLAIAFADALAHLFYWTKQHPRNRLR